MNFLRKNLRCGQDNWLILSGLTVISSVTRPYQSANVINQLIQERYFILKLLGTGGFGDTYLAKDLGRASNPACIVKHLKPASHSAAFQRKVQQLFHRQAEILGRLGEHDQMPALVGYFEQDHEFFIIHDYAEGHILDEEFKPGQRWSESQATELLKGVLEILSFAHTQGVVHGDVKPANLVRRYRDNRLVLVDFGTVKQVETQITTPDGDVLVSIAVSTPGYTATPDGYVIPDYGLDVQAVGYLGIRALTGMSLEEIPRNPETGEYLWASLALANFELEDFVGRLVHPDPQVRYSNAVDAYRALLHLTDFYAPISIGVLAKPETTALGDTPPETLTTAATSLHGELLSETELAQLETWLGDQNPTNTKTAPKLAPASVPTVDRKHQFVIWGSLSAAVIAGLVAVIGGIGLVTNKSEWQTQLNQAQRQKLAGNYEACIELAQAVPKTEQLFNQAQTLRIQCRLGPAQALEKADQREKALPLLAAIPQDDPAYTAAQELLGQWSDALLSSANQAYASGNLNAALTQAQAIPKASPSYKIAQDAMVSWQNESRKNQQILTQARQAFDQQRWSEAIALAQQVRLNGQPIPPDSDYYQQNIAPIVQNAATRQATSTAPANPTPSPSPTGSPASAMPPSDPSTAVIGTIEQVSDAQ